MVIFEVGFFYVVDHGISKEDLQAIFDISRKFFNLSLQEKRKIAVDPNSNSFRGYTELGSEGSQFFVFELKNNEIVTQNKRDWHECIDLGEDCSMDHPEVIKGTPFHGIKPRNRDLSYRTQPLASGSS
jgi:isopenicillin N synthase-like dioxygenase